MDLGFLGIYRRGMQEDIGRKHESSRIVSMPVMVSFGHTTLLSVVKWSLLCLSCHIFLKCFIKTVSGIKYMSFI